MKKFKLSFMLMFFLIMILSSSKVFAYDGQTFTDANGVVYLEHNGKYMVSSYNGTASEISIPDVVNGKIVFYTCSNV